MNIITLLLIALSLAADAFAVAIANGITIKKNRMSHAIQIALFFGGFQALMPVAGFYLGSLLRSSIEDYSTIVSCIILVTLGAKMLHEAIFKTEEALTSKSLSLPTLFLLAVATSIDAFFVGISFVFSDTPLLFAITIIGVITAVLSFIGFHLGNKIGLLFGEKVELIGGITLIALGIKMLF